MSKVIIAFVILALVLAHTTLDKKVWEYEECGTFCI